jgi:hypothetical protein
MNAQKFLSVMPGFMPGIHVFKKAASLKERRGWPGLQARRRRFAPFARP